MNIEWTWFLSLSLCVYECLRAKNYNKWFYKFNLYILVVPTLCAATQNRWSWYMKMYAVCQKITISLHRSNDDVRHPCTHKLLNSIIVIAYCFACASFLRHVFVNSLSFFLFAVLLFQFFHFSLILYVFVLSKILQHDWAWSA